jgi:hypothetical protein
MSAIITSIGKDTYRVENFLVSMPHVCADVRFYGNAPAIIFRNGYDGVGDRDWDRIAIETVQTWLITNHTPSNQAAEKADFERVKNGFLAAAKARRWRGRQYATCLSTYVRNWLAEEKQQTDYCLAEWSLTAQAKLAAYIETAIREHWTKKAQQTKRMNARRARQTSTQLKLPL